jgi:enamine deaminase RidA (YjgF/YER057c/UK114 family)
MTSVAEVEDEISRYFGKEKQPVVSYVEWKSSAPIEIEMVAWGGPARGDVPRVEYITPPFMKASPVYCRVARINYGETIFLSDMAGKPDASPAEELSDSFEQLRDLLGKTASDLKHLVKATYYVTGDEINKQHNEIRPKYYDPARPPAASKAIVEGTGWGTRYTMDMIAVPAGSP